MQIPTSRSTYVLYNVLHMRDVGIGSVYSVQLNFVKPYARLASCMCSPMLVYPYACLDLCPSSPVPVLQLTLVPSVFGGSFFDKAFLHSPVSILHPFTILNGIHCLYTCAIFKVCIVLRLTSHKEAQWKVNSKSCLQEIETPNTDEGASPVLTKMAPEE